MGLQNINLDVSHPDQVARVLRAAAQTFYEDGAELTSAWQSDKAGQPWYQVAGILERAADQCEKAVGHCQDLLKKEDLAALRDAETRRELGFPPRRLEP